MSDLEIMLSAVCRVLDNAATSDDESYRLHGAIGAIQVALGEFAKSPKLSDEERRLTEEVMAAWKRCLYQENVAAVTSTSLQEEEK